jgi:membrane protein implicated in regulation of membrane protease activity
MDIWSWGWLILSAVLLIGEMLTAGFFLIVFGIGALGAFLVAIFGGSVLWQWIVFVVVSTLAFAFSRRFAKKVYNSKSAFGVGAERYEGRRAWVIETVDQSAATGMVRIDREEWRADSVADEVIPAGSWAEVVKVDGTRMVVKTASVQAGTPEDAPAETDTGSDSESEA